jgi:hypothetical protein
MFLFVFREQFAEVRDAVMNDNVIRLRGIGQQNGDLKTYFGDRIE